MHSIRVLFSNVLSNQRKKHHNVQSETRKLLQGADENSEKKTRKLTREKTSMIERKKKKKTVLSSAPDDIQQTLLQLTHFPVPSTVNEEPLKKNVISRNISLVKRKCGTSHVPCTRVMLPWGRQQLRTQFEYERAKVTYDGHFRRCLSTEQGTENGFSEVLRVLVV